ncbi:MAG: orotidine-5'-phosphate decarboxylase [Chloroflexota bacterium]|nr:orotidine-5'-phosphate decarboxylase [Chloroflexota bacterium]
MTAVCAAIAKYEARVDAIGSRLCVGLDSAIERLPARFLDDPQPQFAFNRWIIECTHPFTSAYKPNMAFYEARGADGWHDLALTLDYLRESHPDIVTICDAKRADIDSTNAGYVAAIYDRLGFDAVTLHPYLGGEALQPFLQRADKASIILCRTSNSGAAELQDLPVGGSPLWEVIAGRVRDQWNRHNNCMLVIGATVPDDLRRARALCPDMTFLVPGVGAQGGDAETVVRVGSDVRGRGLIVNAGRSVIFSADPEHEARRLRDAMRLS